MGTPVITIFVRHAEDCKHASKGEFFKGCQCRKHLRWTANGKQHRMKTGTRTWSEAEQAKRNLDDQLAGRPAAKVDAGIVSVMDAADAFKKAKSLEGITADGLARYTRELSRLEKYLAGRGVFTLLGVTGDMLTDYAASWTVSTGTKILTLKTLKCFFRHCYDSEWIPRVPKMPKIADDTEETEPLTALEYQQLIDSVTAPKLHALIQLMRWSGLAVRDASTLSRAELQQSGDVYRVVTTRQKTKTPVCVPIPSTVAAELLAVAGEKYIFWHGQGSGSNYAMGHGARIAEAMDKAGIESTCFMKSHRLRDTFAVDLLQKGVPLEEVSKALGHTSIRTTERHYAKWVKERQDRLDTLVMATWKGAA